VLVLAFADRAHSATNIVTSLADSGAGSLRQVITGSAAGDSIVFGVSGTITLASDELVVSKDLAIIGHGASALTISGADAFRVFVVNGGVHFTVLNLTIANGSSDSGAGIYNGGGYLSVQNCLFARNTANGNPASTNGCGGAVFNSGTATIASSSFVANSAGGAAGTDGTGGPGSAGCGGAVYNLGNLELRDSTFLNNSVRGGQGGAGACPGVAAYPTSGGVGGPGGAGNGGGLFNAGVATVANSIFTGNIASGGTGGPGGAGGIALFPELHIGGGNGGSGGKGGSACGAIYDINGLCFLTNCRVSSNSGFKGAGGPGGGGGSGNPNGAAGPTGPDGEAIGSLRSPGAVLMNTVLTGNAPRGNCSGAVADGGQNFSSDCSCAFTNSTPLNPGLSGLPPFYLLHNFTGQEPYYMDAHPSGGLAASSEGTLYGVTSGVASPGAGAVIKFNNKTGTDSSFAVVRGFTGDPTWGPAGTLALSGNVLYGITLKGGQTNQGTLYRINADGTGYQILHSFGGAGDGRQPDAGVVVSGSTLYGTTAFGGSSGYGTIFKIETNGSGYSIVHDFLGGTSGSSPTAELVLSGSSLYGTTIGSGWGNTPGLTVFKINTDGSGFAVLKNFEATGYGSGPCPSAALALSGSTLFGVTRAQCYYDGAFGCGSVFRINTDGSGFSILRQFPGRDGPGYRAGLVSSSGWLYGTTSGDGSTTNSGSVFMINADGSGYTLLRRFNGMDGAGPNGNLLSLGNMLYGTTENGGFYDAGVAFVVSVSPPVIITMPESRTVELGEDVELTVGATGLPALSCQWFFNATTPVPGAAGLTLRLGAVQFSQSGAYTLVLTNSLGAITSAPVLLNVVAPVERKLVQGVKLTGEAGSLLNVDSTDFLSPAPNWTTLGSVSLTTTGAYWFDGTVPLPAQRFYHAWQTGTPSVAPSLALHLVPAITLTGNIGDSVRLDYINQFGPTDAWVTLATVTLTNTSQLYFDVSAPGQPQRLYRLTQVP
jgi:uncharacterized repeat protein (TIGR03803 family)